MKPTLSNLRAILLFGYNARNNYEIACKVIPQTISMNAFKAIHVAYMSGLRTKIAMVFSTDILDLTVYLTQPVGGAMDRSIS